MKAITIKQPWASLIALGEKGFETRSWRTKYRGEIAIHAGKEIDKDAFYEFRIKRALQKHGINRLVDLPVGAIIATATIDECYEVSATTGYKSLLAAPGVIEEINGMEVVFGDYEPGRFAWKVGNVQKLLEPVKAKGQLSLWNWEP